MILLWNSSSIISGVALPLCGWLDCSLSLSWVKRRHSGLLWTLWGHCSLHHTTGSVKCSKAISLSLHSFFTEGEIKILSVCSVLNSFNSESGQCHLKWGRTIWITLVTFEENYKEHLKLIDWKTLESLCETETCWCVLQGLTGLVAKTVQTPPSSGKST